MSFKHMGGIEGCAKEPLGASIGLIKREANANSGRLATEGIIQRRGPGYTVWKIVGLII